MLIERNSRYLRRATIIKTKNNKDMTQQLARLVAPPSRVPPNPNKTDNLAPHMKWLQYHGRGHDLAQKICVSGRANEVLNFVRHDEVAGLSAQDAREHHAYWIFTHGADAEDVPDRSPMDHVDKNLPDIMRSILGMTLQETRDGYHARRLHNSFHLRNDKTLVTPLMKVGFCKWMTRKVDITKEQQGEALSLVTTNGKLTFECHASKLSDRQVMHDFTGVAIPMNRLWDKVTNDSVYAAHKGVENEYCGYPNSGGNPCKSIVKAFNAIREERLPEFDKDPEHRLALRKAVISLISMIKIN